VTLNRFTARPEATVAYYRAILSVLTEREAPPVLLKPLELAVSRLGAAIPAAHSYPGFKDLTQVSKPAWFAAVSPR
jgi:hypothetical protein